MTVILLLLAGCGTDPLDADTLDADPLDAGAYDELDGADPAGSLDDDVDPDDLLAAMMPGTTNAQPVTHQALAGSWGDTCFLTNDRRARLATAGITPSALNVASRALTAKLRRTVGGPSSPSTNAVCQEMWNQFNTSLRQGDCPNFTGNAVTMSGSPLTAMMNGTEDKWETTTGNAVPGVWCEVELNPKGAAASDPANIYWAVIYGMANWTTAGIVYADPGATNPSTHAIFGMSYYVPNSVYPTWSQFLAATNGLQIVGLYPPGATFTLQGISMTLVDGNATTAPTGSVGFFTLDPTGTAVIDPDDSVAVEMEQELLDEFMDANVAAGTLSETCVYESADWDPTALRRRIRAQLGPVTAATTCP